MPLESTTPCAPRTVLALQAKADYPKVTAVRIDGPEVLYRVALRIDQWLPVG